MNIICSFYIGHQDYLEESPQLSELESRANLTEEIYKIVSKNIGLEQFTVYQPKNSHELKASIVLNGNQAAASGFSTETAIADDQNGLPVLFYVNAHFEVPDEFDLETDIDSTLQVGDYSIKFEGVVEIDEDS